MNLNYKPILVLLMAMSLLVGTAGANNISVTNVAIVERNDAARYALISFDLSWENSFRSANLTTTANNWDAAWCFVKWRKSDAPEGGFHHGTLATEGHTYPTGFEGELPADKLGVFVKRAAEGEGPVTLEGIELRWDYNTDGVLPDDEVDIRVFAVEMVYVPACSFKIGTGGQEAGGFTNGSWVSGASLGLTLSNGDAITVGNQAGELWATGSIEAGTLPAAFPNGYDAFYAMKHEITQQAWADFLNSLSRDGQNARTGTDLSATTITTRYVMSNSTAMQFRNGLRCDATLSASGPVTIYCDMDGDGIGNEANDGQHVACNFLSPDDLLAYLDWAALRPLTELEYEKICRGQVNPVAGEYAWGSAGFTAVAALTDACTSTETSATPSGNLNCGWPGFAGPIRVGFGAGTSGNRFTAGGAYWGMMEMSGNVTELVVSVGKEAWRGFAGNHGDGQLTTAGACNSSSWLAASLCERGGAWTDETTSTLCQVADRSRVNMTTPLTVRQPRTGGRGGRTSL